MQLAALRTFGFKLLLDHAVDQMGARALERTPNTQLFNQTGQPAKSEPQYWTDDGQPIKLPAGWMSDGPWILKALSRACRSRGPGQCSRAAAI